MVLYPYNFYNYKGTLMKKVVYSLQCALLICLTSGCSCKKVCPTEQTQYGRPPTSKVDNSMNNIITTPSGLQYIVLQEPKDPNAPLPKKGQFITVHYTGWLADAYNEPDMTKKFDSSVDRGTPFSFNVGIGQVIRGWDEALSTMRPGEKRRLIIPAGLGYGARGAGAKIPPNSTLIFDVEMLEEE